MAYEAFTMAVSNLLCREIPLKRENGLSKGKMKGEGNMKGKRKFARKKSTSKQYTAEVGFLCRTEKREENRHFKKGKKGNKVIRDEREKGKTVPSGRENPKWKHCKADSATRSCFSRPLAFDQSGSSRRGFFTKIFPRNTTIKIYKLKILRRLIMSQLDFVLPSQKVYGFDGSASAVDKPAEIWTVSAGSGKRRLNCWREDGVCARKRPKRSRRKMRKNQKIEAEFPAAPYNTNEFLMDEHDELQEDFRPSPTADDNVTLTENAFFDKEFSSTYADVRAERLHDMSKLQLITEYLQLEDRVDRLERRLKELGVPAVIDSRPKLFATPRHEFETPADLHLDAALDGDDKSDEDSDTATSSHDGVDHATAEKIRIFEQEISNLENTNWLLRQQFDHLQHVLTNRRELCWCPAPTSSSATPPFPPISSPSSHFSSRPPSPSPSSTSSSSSSSSSASSSSDSDNSDPDSDSRDSSSDSESDSDESLSVCSTRCSCCSTDGAELNPQNVE